MQSSFGKQLYRLRTAIERAYGNATSFGGGMGPLPGVGARLGSSADLGVGQTPH